MQNPNPTEKSIAYSFARYTAEMLFHSRHLIRDEEDCSVEDTTEMESLLLHVGNDQIGVDQGV